MILGNLIFYIHLASLAIAAVGILIADNVGLLWIRGASQTLSPTTLKRLHDLLSYALTALILSGLLMFWPQHEYLITQPLFLLKMGFVAALIINSILIDRLMIVATKLPFKEVSSKGKAVLLASGAFSLLCWVGTALTAVYYFGL